MAAYEFKGKMYYRGASMLVNVDGLRGFKKRTSMDKIKHNEFFIFYDYDPKEKIITYLKKTDYCSPNYTKDIWHEERLRPRIIEMHNSVYEISERKQPAPTSSTLVWGWVIYIMVMIFGK